MAMPTPSQTVGPFFARELLWSDGGKVLFAGHGDRITLTGRVFDGAGAPVVDALFETWQADAAGKLPIGRRGRPGRTVTAASPRTPMAAMRSRRSCPARSRAPGGETYAPQISVTIFARGLLKAVQTRVFLAPLDAIKDDPLARAIGDPDRLRTLVAQRDPGNPKIYRWDVRLQGAGETVFIEL